MVNVLLYISGIFISLSIFLALVGLVRVNLFNVDPSKVVFKILISLVSLCIVSALIIIKVES